MSNEYFEDIYYRNIDRIYRICYIYFKGNKYDIEDAINSIFTKVLEKNMHFESLEHEKSWLIVVTNNYCKNKVKHWWNKNQELDFDVQAQDKKDETLQFVFDLPDKYKIPIYMHYYEGYSGTEIADILNIKENTIYSYLHQGREMLKEMLEEGS